MRITLLGTGSADGWPNPFCACASCSAERADGRSRAPSSALLDDAVLIDCGPTTPHLPAALHLRDVAHVLITHGHPDHLHPAFLLSRSWVAGTGPLDVWGPPGAIDLCRDWLAPDSPVRLHAIAAGDARRLETHRGDYVVHALPAEHAHGDGDRLALEALLYVVTGPDGGSLLYATDTGTLPASTAQAVGGPVDVVLVDETFGDHTAHGTGHHDLATLPDTLATLTEAGVIADSTRVFATHLSHHNPPTRDLRARLAPLGVSVADDRDVIDTARTRGTVTLVLGGARSGKSSHAERLASGCPDVVYVATGGARDGDGEWAERVAAHRARRPAHWTTVESTDLVAVLSRAPRGTVVLIDCLGLWLTARLDEIDAWARAEAGDAAAVQQEALAAVDAVLAALGSCAADVVLVSNEVGMGVVPATASGRLFRDLLGIANTRVSAASDETVLVVAGRPTLLGGARHG